MATATARRKHLRTTGAQPALTSAYSYELGPWLLDEKIGRPFAEQRNAADNPAPLGVCEACWYAQISDTTPGLTYLDATDENDRPYRLCPDCLACTVFQSGGITSFGRWPNVVIREADGTMTPSPRGVKVIRGPTGEWVLLAITSHCALAQLPVVVPDGSEADRRRAYAGAVRCLDAVDPFPDFADALPDPVTFR